MESNTKSAFAESNPYENSRQDTGEIQAVKSLADERY